jgi:Uma2 family endonuclease
MYCAARRGGDNVVTMHHPALTDVPVPARWTSEQYLSLVREGVLAPEDRVELLEGVIVTVAPSNVRHQAGVVRVSRALFRAVGELGVVRIQLPLAAGAMSLPEPDAAVVAGDVRDYDDTCPTTALLVVEVADSSLKQDRITKRAIYAAAGIPEYWIVNLQDDCVEVRRSPEPAGRRYASITIARRGDRIEPIALPAASIAVDDLLPSGGR